MKVIVEGEYACFTRPELKVERVSYDVPTPSALEGLLKSVYWKPSFRYVIDKVIVFNPIKFANIRRNEVKEKVKYRSVVSKMKGGDKDPAILTAECRNQRASSILKDVRYGISFHIEMTGLQCESSDEKPEKHLAILERRLKKGQSFRTPCLGCAEFSARKIELVSAFNFDEICNENKSVDHLDLGFMLYGLHFQDEGRPVNSNWDMPKFSDLADPVFYRPKMHKGVIDVAKYASERRC